MKMSLATSFKSKTMGFVISGFSLVCGLAVNDVVKQAIQTYFPLTSDSLLAKIIYALILILMLVIFIDYIQKLDLEKESEAVYERARSALITKPVTQPAAPVSSAPESLFQN